MKAASRSLESRLSCASAISPNTDWLPEEILREERGFIRTGPELAETTTWPLERDPFSLETGMPGVFAVGDVRAESMNRVAAAVGEGSIAVRLVHDLFESDRRGDPAQELRQRAQ
jgi:thioredoxin reductase (NADPH)